MSPTLYHGDCLDVLPTLEAQSVDAIICDPPYGTTACKWDSVIPFAPMWAEIRRVLKPRGACVLFGSQPFTSALVMSNPKWFRYELVWQKSKATGFLDARRKPMDEHENILVFSDKQTKYNPQMTKGRVHVRNPLGGKITEVYGEFSKKPSVSDEFFPRSIIAVKNAYYTDGKQAHPTQKPLALLEYLVRTYTDPGNTVLDFTMGSGTTGHACMNLGRAFVGIERDAAYFAIAQERIADAASPLRHMEAA